MGFAPAVEATGALLLIFADLPERSESLRTGGSVTIEDSAGITIVSSPPLQLILSSGSVASMQVPYSRADASDSPAEMVPDVLANVGEWGSSVVVSSSGEVLSVSVRSDEVGSLAGRGRQFKAVIAQFN